MVAWQEVVGGAMRGWAEGALHSWSGEDMQELSLALKC